MSLSTVFIGRLPGKRKPSIFTPDPIGDPASRMVAAAELMSIFRDHGAYSRGLEADEYVLDIFYRTNISLLDREDQQLIDTISRK